jgi:hypothetical protein
MKLSLLLLLAITLFTACHQQPKHSNPHLPGPMGDDETENLEKRKRWIESSHRTAPGTNWRTIEAANAARNRDLRRQSLLNGPTGTQESFANGQLTGNWQEKGPANIAGSVVAADYDPISDYMYTIGAGGALWRTPISTTPDWTILNDDFQFDSRAGAIKVFNKIGGGRRLLISRNEKVFWSDDEGANFTQSSLTYPVGWGGNYVSRMVVLDDVAKTVYILTHNWDDVLGWSPRHYLWRSTDQGQTFTRIHIFTTGNDDQVQLVQPYNSNEVFVTDVSATASRLSLYQVSGAGVTPISSATVTPNGGTSPVAGVQLGGTLTLYLLRNNNELYKRVRNGSTWADWQFVSTTATSSWNRLAVAMDDANKVFYGEVDAYGSTNGGLNFTQLSSWVDYYGNEDESLHADMMEIHYFKTSSNTIFQLINTHGGLYISYDDMGTKENLSLTGLHNSQAYDVLTDTLDADYVYNGTQDQGIQRFDNALTPGINNAFQFLSGDYGYLCLTNNNTRLWAMYPGEVTYFTNPLDNLFNNDPWGVWGIPGANLGNAGWMPPMKSTSNAGANEVFVGGGNIAGGNGSYLIKLQASVNTPITFTPTQYSYDFRANSNTGTSSISALEVSVKEPGKLYVATEDGAFFYSNNNGTTWSKTPTFNGTNGWFLYGQTILASRLTNGLVWYGGSGYSNPGVFKSTNGGASFTAMNNGLPQTLVHDLAANANESMLFAATDAGPYVYVVADNQWYPMIGAITPTQMYTSVEYVRSINTVRFGTHGRGILDFAIAASLPVTGLELTAKQTTAGPIQLNWTTLTETNNKLFEVERSVDGRNFATLLTQPARGDGNSNVKQSYQAMDNNPPVAPATFYRITQIDKNGQRNWSNIVKINMEKGVLVTLSPNPVRDQFTLTGVADVQLVRVINSNGAVVKQFGGATQYNVAQLAAGTYVLLVNTADGQTQRIRMVKQ